MATFRTLRSVQLFQGLAYVVVFTLVWLQVSPAYGLDSSLRRETARQETWRLAHMPHMALAPGLTQTPDAALQKKITAKEAAVQAQKLKPVSDVRSLSAAEMSQALGRGPLRNPYFNGTLPWQKSLRDVNLCNGNLFKSFTDIQVAPARGAGLVLQRTYNSNDARVGPFGVGWTHAYDIRIQEAADVQSQSGDPSAVPPAAAGSSAAATTVNEVPRTDFFGAKHTYHRDADGLYSPPAYLYDETSSDYGKFLVNGPPQVMDDTEKGMDGTIKHYVNIVTKADGTSGNERACDYIQDRYGNKTTLTYGQCYLQPDGSTRKILTQVADPTGRTLTFQWTNFGTTSSPIYRITEVDAPTDPATGNWAYRVVYAYYGASDANAGGAAYQLKSVTLDPDGLSRTTTYTYTSYTGTYYDANQNPQSATEYGLLASVSDPLGHTVSYTYSAVAYVGNGTFNDAPQGYVVPKPTRTVCVSTVTEPAGVDASNNPRTQTWTIVNVGDNIGTDTIATSTSGAYVFAGIDNQLRFSRFFVSSPAQYLDVTTYDNNNNVQDVQTTCYIYGPQKDYAKEDTYTYGQHGNVLTHQFGSSAYGPFQTCPGTDMTTYYNASQYFQQASVTDGNYHTTVMGIGTSTAGNAGDPDTNIGDRGQTLWVQDAGYNDSSSPSYHKQFTYTYNQWGQKLSETNLNGVVTQYTYGTSGTDLGNLIIVVQDPGTGHLNRTTTMHYDIMGRVLSSTDPAGQTSTFTYNSLGQPKTVATPAKSGSPAETISYAYDGNGRTHSVSDNRGSTVLAYEAGSDRVSSVTDPVTGTVSYTYRASGERLTMTLPGGGIWNYSYTDTTDTVGLPYPSNNGHWNGTFNGGPILQVVGLWIMPKGDPDSLSLMPNKITDDQGRIISFTLNFAGQIITEDTNQVYTTQGTQFSRQTTACLEDNPHPEQHPYFLTHGWLAQTQTTWYGQNANQQPIHRIVSENDYGYDTMGQRTANTQSVQATNSDGSGQVDSNSNPIWQSQRTETYTYDDLNRLSTVDYGDGETQGYGFDPMGNRLSKSDSVTTGGTTTTTTTASTFDAANRLLTTAQNGGSASAVTSDADGNTLTDTGGRTMTWDSQNRMASCTKNGVTSNYTYGADGLRRSSTVNGVTTYYVYDGQTMIREMKRNPQTGALFNTATYLQGPRGGEYRRDDTQTELDSQGRQVSVCRWYVYDGLGSVVGEVDPAGNLTSSPKYDVYGAVRANSGTASSRQGFVGGLGHVSDTETGLVYMRARYYDPQQGRFSSEDTSKDGKNWFIYAANNPINNTDFSGNITDTQVALGFLLNFFGPWLAKKTLDRLVTWSEKKGLTAGDLSKWLQRDGQGKVTAGGEEAAEGGAEVGAGDAMDDAGAPLMVEGKKTLEGGLKETIEGYTEEEVGSFIGLNPIYHTSGESQLLLAQVSGSSWPQTPWAANSRGWNAGA